MKRTGFACACVGLLLLWTYSTVPSAAEAAAPPKAMPDFTGVWRITESLNPDTGAPTVISVESVMTRLRRDVLARVASNVRRGESKDRGYCTPAAFTGPMGYGVAPMGIFPVNFEVIASPGRLTLIDATGMVRRVLLRSTPPADALDESNAGTSIARWDGAQLLVQTTGLNSTARVIIGAVGAELGRNARIDEQISMPARDVLQIITTIRAPDLYFAPVTTTHRYRRDSKAMLTEISICEPNDRSFDLTTGAERFDATPPTDLPPPPR